VHVPINGQFCVLMLSSCHFHRRCSPARPYTLTHNLHPDPALAQALTLTLKFQGGAVGAGVLLLHDLLLCAVLQLLAVQSLQHVTHWGIGRWAYGGAVAAAVLVLSQVKTRV